MAKIKKTLYRLPGQGQILGVCAGIAEYLDIDVTLVRIVTLILAFATGGTLVLVYFILSLVIPVDPSDSQAASKNPQYIKTEYGNRFRNYSGLIFIMLGLWLLMAQFFPMWIIFRWDYIWPIILIFIGFLIITKKR